MKAQSVFHRHVEVVAASTEPPLEIDGSVRADCELARNSPLRKCAEVGSCNPRFRRLDFALTVIAAVRVGRKKLYTSEKGLVADVALASARSAACH